MNDIVFDLDNKFITNRPDLFSVIGNAREIACIEKQDFQTPTLPAPKRENTTPLTVDIKTDKVTGYTLTKFSLPNHPETPLVIQIILKRSNQ